MDSKQKYIKRKNDRNKYQRMNSVINKQLVHDKVFNIYNKD